MTARLPLPRPQAILFDMDGVLADVSGSYRQAIIATAGSYGIRLETSDISRAKAEGGANNDWELTRRLLQGRGVEADLAQVTERFEAIYQGHGETPGLRESETLLAERPLFERLAGRMPIGVVTGRPRSDCHRFLESAGIADLIRTSVCMEDGPCKPDPFPVRRALEVLGVTVAWMVGDTVDDIRAARAAGVVPLGIPAPGENPQEAATILSAAGAERVLSHLRELEDLLL